MAMYTQPIKPFLDEHFLLQSPLAQQLYHEVAASLPIVDYHCHLSPEAIAANHQFTDLTEAWLAGDHYKWRAMRTHGISESHITGDASAWDKFRAFAETIPYSMRNPLYHWTHMELQHPFGIHELLNEASAANVFAKANELLATDDFRVLPILQGRTVEVIGTTDDPCDDLRAHQLIAKQEHGIRVYPTFRPDKSLVVGDVASYNAYLDRLGASADLDIRSLDDLLAALQVRIRYFHERGCRLADHGLAYLPVANASGRSVKQLFNELRRGKALAQTDLDRLQMNLMQELGAMYHAHGWTMQLHLGAMRNNSTRMMRTLGPDTGFDSIGDYRQGPGLAAFLDGLDLENQLPQTILYNLNPVDNELFATMVGNFNDGSVAGKVQWGSAWWFLDQKDGMTKQLNALSNMGLLGHFVGMLTDSRSFLSYSRHEYFRRLLCNLFADDIIAGELPHDVSWVSSLIRKICYENARDYFHFPHNQA